MDLTGTYDKASQTMTLEGMGPGTDGTPTKHILTTKYNADGTRVLTMHMQAGDEMMKIFEKGHLPVNTRVKNGLYELTIPFGAHHSQAGYEKV